LQSGVAVVLCAARGITRGCWRCLALALPPSRLHRCQQRLQTINAIADLVWQAAPYALWQDVRVIQLSLCIATLNRARFIGATLDSIMCQLDPEVELVILDGGSRDDTGAVVAARAADRDAVRYIREETNSGIDADFDRAVGYARGQYCWLLADDDLLMPGAVARVLQACRQGFDLVVINAEVRSADLSQALNAHRLPYRADKTYAPEDMDTLFAETAFHLTFIGAAAIRRAIWQQRDRTSFYGSEFVHVGVIFQAPMTGPALVIAEPLIMIRYGNAHWTARAFEIWMFKWPQMIWSFADVSDAAKLAVTPREPWRKAGNLLLLRAKGAYGRDEYRRLLRPKITGRAAFWPALISHVPGAIVNLAAIVYVYLLSPGSKGTLQDLFASRYWLGNIIRTR
jgi:abequosyltransferase